MSKSNPFIYIGDTSPPIPCTNHEWKVDFIGDFTGKVYESCKKCGIKKEKYNEEVNTITKKNTHNED